MTSRDRVGVAGALLLTFSLLRGLPVEAASEKACLTGSAPVVAGDAAKIVVLKAAVDSACPCEHFDGSEGAARRDYLRCVSPLIKTAVSAGDLRRECKGPLGKAFKLSTCGLPDPGAVAPCIETSARGRRRCKVLSVAKCVDKPGSFTRLACSAHRDCVAAGDTNGDYRIDADDSGGCIATPTPIAPATSTFAPSDTATETATVLPTDTPTKTATLSPTDTPTETHTGTSSPTATPSPALTFTGTSTQTPTLTPTGVRWYFCADQNETCILPGGPVVVRYGRQGYFFEKIIDASSVACDNSLVDDPEFDVDLFAPKPYEELDVELNPRIVAQCEYSPNAPPPASSCPEDVDTAPLVFVGLDADNPDFREYARFDHNGPYGCPPASGCAIVQPVVALDPHTWDARDTIDPRACRADMDSFDFHWQLFYPALLSIPGVYASQGISGYYSPVLTFGPNTLPNQSQAGGPPGLWRMLLTVTQRTEDPMTPVNTREARFRFDYSGSPYTLSLTATCQTKTVADPDCPVTTLLRATEPF